MACSHDHDCGEVGCAGSSLWGCIDHGGVRCLNAVDPAAAAAVLRPWEERRSALADGLALRSQPGDPELLMTVPFTRTVTLSGITVAGGGSGASPVRLLAWANREVDFDTAHSIAPAQAWDLADGEGSDELEYPCRRTAFTAVHTLVLLFPANGGADSMVITFFGLRGTQAAGARIGAVKAVYEARPQPKDHAAPASEAPRLQLT